MQIPIENIYYLLCYAWNKLEEKDRVEVSIDDTTELVDLFAKILINGCRILLKRGVDRRYVEHSEEYAGVKGKIDFSRTLKGNLLSQQRTYCTFEELSSNTLPNRILVSTMRQLMQTERVSRSLVKDLRGLLYMLPEVDPIHLSSRVFNEIRLTRNNRFYGFILNICRLIHECTFPSEQPGRYQFSDFTRDERKMNQLFEAFIRNFYRIEQSEFSSVRKEVIRWRFGYADDGSGKYLPQMQTDITLENAERKIIIDAKYYSETMSRHYGNEKIVSGNLYQIFSYLLNQETDEPKTQNATGILLYPTIRQDYDLDFQYNTHTIAVRTVDLNTHWKNIANRLQAIIQTTNH